MSGHWVKWIAIPEGCDENTHLGLRCTKKNFVYSVGRACNAIARSEGGFYAVDNFMHTIETHETMCGCELEVVPFSL